MFTLKKQTKPPHFSVGVWFVATRGNPKPLGRMRTEGHVVWLEVEQQQQAGRAR